MKINDKSQIVIESADILKKNSYRFEIVVICFFFIIFALSNTIMV